MDCFKEARPSSCQGSASGNPEDLFLAYDVRVLNFPVPVLQLHRQENRAWEDLEVARHPRVCTEHEIIFPSWF